MFASSIPSWVLPGLATLVGVALPLYAWRARGRSYALFTAVVLAFSLPAALVLQVRLESLLPGAAITPWRALHAYLLVAVGLHFSSLVRARLRAAPFRLGVSLPAMAFLALGAMAGPWLLALLPIRLVLLGLGLEAPLAWLAWADWAPHAVMLASLGTSLAARPEWVRIQLDGATPETVTRLAVERHRRIPPTPALRPLRIVQLTDPHLGPWQPVERLRERVEELLDHDPDLVLLTGDFLTMEGNGTPGALAASLAPLQAVRGRCFAIFGNHDHEAPDEVRAGLASAGVSLLVDEATSVTTPAGRVQIVGSDWHRREAPEKLGALLRAHPREPGALRLLLLHDPSAFQHVLPDEVDLTLSGHTHGGQVGLVSLGFDWTVLSGTRWPDHGLFGLGSSRLYVHRGTGFYGFPLRIGVPGEHSVLELLPSAIDAGGPVWRSELAGGAAG